MNSLTRSLSALALVVTAQTLTACSASGPATGALNTTHDRGQTHCRTHQHLMPGHDYTAGKNGKTLAVLEMMKYYTAEADFPFCDGKPATTQDAAWSHLYNDLARP
ncbi:hypothetical protein V2S66_28915 [Streptomyces sp. V4-01]|uniref:Uncharacterized protein n=1 Tax=Actinacidiphila polyblastidii TaxID=3110430 RepID=A0ABU7PLM8_9ACTN|nr:hypothetical protein [Streptomyces sp. V4-01]